MKPPPGSWLPRLLQVGRFLRDPTGFLTECGTRYGELFALHDPRGPHVLLTHLETIRELYAATYEDVEVTRDRALTRVLGGSVLSLDGPPHYRRRRLVMPALHKEHLQRQSSVLRELTEAAIAGWPVGPVFKLRPAMQELTMQIILRTIVGLRSGARLGEARRLLRTAAGYYGNPQVLIPLSIQERMGRYSAVAGLLRLREEFDQQLDEELAERRATGDKGEGDVLSMLMAARDEEGQPLSDKELRDELVSLVIAGYDTTSNSLSWVLSCLLADPALLARLTAEHRAPTRPGEAPVAMPALSASLLDATIREALRLHPVFPYLSRALRAPRRVLGYDLPAGTDLAPCMYLVHRRPDIYPEPERFLPERFLTFRPSPVEWMPFGGGLHRCVGSAAAMLQMNVVLATILSRAVLRPVPGPPARAVLNFFSLVPSDGVPATLVERLPQPTAAPATTGRVG